MQAGFLRAAAVAATLSLPQAGAAAVIYSEAVSGDTSALARPSLTLVAGDNDILGTTTFAFSGSDGDGYSLLVGAGLQITSIVFTTTLQTVGAGQFTIVGWDLTSSSGFLGTTPVPIPTAGASAFTGVLPLGQGSYDLAGVFFSGSLLPGEFRSADYTIRVAVAQVLPPVPLPAAAGLLATALGALAVAGRRRRA